MQNGPSFPAGGSVTTTAATITGGPPAPAGAPPLARRVGLDPLGPPPAPPPAQTADTGDGAKLASLRAANEKRIANLRRARQINEARQTEKFHAIGRVLAQQSATAQEQLEFGREEWLPIADLEVDRTYQRALRPRRAQSIAEHFNPEALGRFHVSRRADGKHYLIDGQHRQAGMKLIDWWDGYTVPCIVYTGLTVEQEADLYHLLNDEMALSSKDDFKARVVAGDGEATAIVAALRARGAGLSVAPNNSRRDGEFACFGALEVLWRSYRQDFDEVISLIVDSWPKSERDAYTATMVQGVATFVRKYRGQYDRKHLVARLRAETAASLLRQRATAKEFIKTPRVALAYVIYCAYQRHKRGARLPEWRNED